MSSEQLSGRQMDLYERVWSRVMLASGATLLLALAGIYIFWNDRIKMLACGGIALASIVVLSIAAVRLRGLGRGLNGSDREARARIQDGLDGVDD